MGRAKVTRKDKAYKLFSEGCVPSSQELKNLGLSESTRYSYYSGWKEVGQPAPSVEEKAKGKAHIPPPSGETIAPITEVPVEESKGKVEESKGEEEESKGAEEKKSRIPATVGVLTVTCH